MIIVSCFECDAPFEYGTSFCPVCGAYTGKSEASLMAELYIAMNSEPVTGIAPRRFKNALYIRISDLPEAEQEGFKDFLKNNAGQRYKPNHRSTGGRMIPYNRVQPKIPDEQEECAFLDDFKDWVEQKQA